MASPKEQMKLMIDRDAEPKPKVKFATFPREYKNTYGVQQEVPHPAGEKSAVKRTSSPYTSASHPAGEGSTKLPKLGAAASLISTAKGIDSILKGKKDVLKETGIRKTPEEL